MNYLIQFRMERMKRLPARKISNQKVIHLRSFFLHCIIEECSALLWGVVCSWKLLYSKNSLLLTWTWNIVIESSSICTRTASFFPPPRECDVDVDPSTPDGVLNECVIRLLGCPLEGPSEFRDIALFSVQLATFLKEVKHFYITSTFIKFFTRCQHWIILSLTVNDNNFSSLR